MLVNTGEKKRPNCRWPGCLCSASEAESFCGDVEKFARSARLACDTHAMGISMQSRPRQPASPYEQPYACHNKHNIMQGIACRHRDSNRFASLHDHAYVLACTSAYTNKMATWASGMQFTRCATIGTILVLLGFETICVAIWGPATTGCAVNDCMH